MVEKLDIHKTDFNFEYYYNRLDGKEMSKRQVDQIRKFILEAQIGKNSKKKVGKHRLIANLQSFFKLANYFKKDFDKLTEEDIIKFSQDLENNRIKQRNGTQYKESSKNELIRSLKRYLKWIWNEKDYNKKIRWVKEFEESSEVPALSMKEIETLANKMKFLRDKTLTLFLGDSGCRIEEALNLKISDVELKAKENGEQFYIVNIRVSKTLPRKISVPMASKILTQWLKEHPAITDKDSYLFPVTYDAYRKVLRIAAKEVFSYSVNPHQLRHSSASYYCKKINNPYKFCYRYGWHFNSPMAKRYIDRTQLEEDAQEQLDNLIKNSKVQEMETKLEHQDKAINTIMQVLESLASDDKKIRTPKGELISSKELVQKISSSLKS